MVNFTGEPCTEKMESYFSQLCRKLLTKFLADVVGFVYFLIVSEIVGQKTRENKVTQREIAPTHATGLSCAAFYLAAQ